jgi:hypothetical protein
VNGPPRKYGGFILSPGTQISGDYATGAGTWKYKILGYYSGKSSFGALFGSRLGRSWASLGDKDVTGATSIDYHATVYGGPFALGLGYTSESGKAQLMPGTDDDVGYGGVFVEPAVGIPLGPFYVGAVTGIIKGTTSVKRGGNSTEQQEGGVGLRPGVRFGLGLFSKGIINVKLSADFRYLIAGDIMLSPSGSASYGGWSSVFAFNFLFLSDN